MQAEKPKLVRLVSPKGAARYPRLNSPSTRFKPQGEYSVKLACASDETTAKYIEQIKEIARVSYKEHCERIGKPKLKMAEWPWKEDNGQIVFKFAAVAKIVTKLGKEYDNKVALFDVKGHPVTEMIGAGSVLKAAADINTWYSPALGFGVSLRLKAVQVIDLKAPSNLVSADAYGFTTEEEGFVSGGETFDDSLFGSEEEKSSSPSEEKSSEPTPNGEDF